MKWLVRFVALSLLFAGGCGPSYEESSRQLQEELKVVRRLEAEKAAELERMQLRVQEVGKALADIQAVAERSQERLQSLGMAAMASTPAIQHPEIVAAAKRAQQENDLSDRKIRAIDTLLDVQRVRIMKVQSALDRATAP